MKGKCELNPSQSYFHRIPIILVGNKNDLHMERYQLFHCTFCKTCRSILIGNYTKCKWHFFLRVISTEAGKQLANSWKAIFLETSAKELKVASHSI